MGKYLIFILTFCLLQVFNLYCPSSQSDTNIEFEEYTLFDKTYEIKIKNSMLSNGKFFTKNSGQVDSEVRYYVRGHGIWFTDSSMVIFEQEKDKQRVQQIEFTHCNNVIPYGIVELPNRSNYFYGNDPDKWVINVPAYEQLYYENLYDNIDLRFYFDREGLNYEVIINPDGEPEDIEIDFGSLESRSLRSNNPMMANPSIYSTYIGGNDEDIVEDIILDNEKNVYATGITSSSVFPVIDGCNDTTHNGYKDIFILKLNAEGNDLLYSTFIGGKENDTATAIDIDDEGNIYITGSTESDDFPTTPGANDTIYNLNRDAIICKLNPTLNTLIYSTYIGGLGDEVAWDIFVNHNNDAYITGATTSNDFPTTSEAFNITFGGNADVFVTRFNETGSMILNSTFIGGSIAEIAYTMTIDNENNILIAGWTQSPDFPSTEGVYNENFAVNDNFISKFNSNLSILLSSTSIGSFGVIVTPSKISTDSNNNIYVAGITSNHLYPMTSNAFDNSFDGILDAILIELDTDLSHLKYSTFLGGKGDDRFYDFYIDTNSQIITFIGITTSSDFPTLDGVFDRTYNGKYDVFVAKLDINNSKLLYGSYIGGNGDDFGWAMGIDDKGYVYIGGNNTGGGFPVMNTSYCSVYNGGLSDGFLMKLKLNTAPRIIDLNISKSVIYRPDNVLLYSNASDLEDPEECLRPHFEYNGPDDLGWHSTNFAQPSYDNDRWQAKFNITTEMSTGFYNFRVRYNDSDGLYTRWHYLNGSLRVFNNAPAVDFFNISTNVAWINETIKIMVNGTDIEDDPNELIFDLEYKYSDNILWTEPDHASPELTGSKWIFTVNISQELEYGFYDFRVRAVDMDGAYSRWRHLNRSLEIISAYPSIITMEVTKQAIYRTDFFEIYISSTDPDSKIFELFVELQFKEEEENEWKNLSVDVINNRWESYVISKKSWSLGNYSFRARVTDLEDNKSPWYFLNNSLLVLNNIPEILDMEGIPVETYRKTTWTIKVNGKDKENSEEELNIELDYRPMEGKDWLSDYFSEPVYSDNCWNIDLNLPGDAPTGPYSFRARVQDMDGDWSPYLYMNDSMLVSNALPGVISFEQSPAEVYRTETVQITASGSDLETAPELLVCEIYYMEPGSTTWNQLTVGYNNTSSNWNSELITTKTSNIGNYSFRVQLTDNDGASSKMVYANESVWVRNNLPEISAELDDIKVVKIQYILKLTDYGYDVETSKGQLRWQIDTATINTDLYHIETENIGSQEITIYPVKNKKGNDELTIILIDSDGGRVVRTDVTIIVDSKSSIDGTIPGDDESPISDLTKGSNLWIIILIVIMVIIFITIFVIYYRKKRKAEEGSVLEEQATEIAEAEETKPEEPGQLPSASEESPALDAPAPGVTTALEPPQVPAPVPMPEPAETSLLPSAGEAENVERETSTLGEEAKNVVEETENIERKTSALVGETKNVERKTSTGDVETEPDEALQI